MSSTPHRFAAYEPPHSPGEGVGEEGRPAVILAAVLLLLASFMARAASTVASWASAEGKVVALAFAFNSVSVILPAFLAMMVAKRRLWARKILFVVVALGLTAVVTSWAIGKAPHLDYGQWFGLFASAVALVLLYAPSARDWLSLAAD